jgi:hypothetical protein
MGKNPLDRKKVHEEIKHKIPRQWTKKFNRYDHLPKANNPIMKEYGQINQMFPLRPPQKVVAQQ